MKENEKKVKLLLVDDEIEFLDSTARALRRRGFNVTTVQNPAVGLRLLECEHFDVAVLDVKMPGIPGDQMFRKIKRRWPNTPVIMLTGHGNVDQAFETSKEGVFDYLTKPCEIEKLVQVCLDAVAASLREEPPEAETDADAEIKVLIVDDEEDFRHSLSTTLERRNMRVTTASGGEQALKILDGTAFDVVLLDLKMPGMDGLETLRRIKAVNNTCEVILLTGLPTVASVMEALREGAFDYVVKPQDTDLLVNKIKGAFRLKNKKTDEARTRKISEILSRNND